jgi:hypothetical protein
MYGVYSKHYAITFEPEFKELGMRERERERI